MEVFRPIVVFRRSGRLAMTLIELLVVVSIIAVLMALLLPAIQAARESARRSQCANNLRQQGLAVNMYAEQHGGALPALWRTDRMRPWENFPWRVSVLPFLESQSVYDALHLNELPLDQFNRHVLATPLDSFQCPSAPGYARRIEELGFAESAYTGLRVAAHDYVGVHDVSTPSQLFPQRGAFNGGPDLQVTSENHTADPNPPIEMDRLSPQLRVLPGKLKWIVDGMSQTALLVEQAGKPAKFGPNRAQEAVEPGEGAWGTCDFSSFFSDGVNTNNYSGPYGFHAGVNVAMCDGSVHLWSESMAAEVIVALLSRDAGEIISAQDWQ